MSILMHSRSEQFILLLQLRNESLRRNDSGLFRLVCDDIEQLRKRSE